jgi:hypothetical protein
MAIPALPLTADVEAIVGGGREFVIVTALLSDGIKSNSFRK